MAPFRQSKGLIKMSAKLEGLRELDNQLKELGAVAAVKVMQGQVRHAMKPVLERAKAMAPVDEGALRDGLAIRVLKPSQTKKSSVMAGIVVRPPPGMTKAYRRLRRLVKEKWKQRSLKRELIRNSATWRWHFVEFGTSKMAARPFLRPAMDASADGIVTEFRKDLRKRIHKLRAKRFRRYKAERRAWRDSK